MIRKYQPPSRLKRFVNGFRDIIPVLADRISEDDPRWVQAVLTGLILAIAAVIALELFVFLTRR